MFGHKGKCIWLTGLSGSGKSTLASEIEYILHYQGKHTYILDGDNIRSGINSNLGFSTDDRKENIRRISEIAKLFVDAGVIVLVAVISPYREDREIARSKFNKGDFIEVHVDCSLYTCIQRDTKGLYRKAMNGEIPYFTGISSPYEPPLKPDVVVNTDKENIGESMSKILNVIKGDL